jgi:hypothetical protein
MYAFAAEPALNLEQARARLRSMDDDQLKSYGKASFFMCTPDAN